MLIDILILIWMHFIADFLLQTRKVGENKSGSNTILLWHVTLYSIPFFWFGWQYALINAAGHFVTDWFTSRGTKWAYKNNEMAIFWGIIGFDQAIHMSTLILTYWWLV